MVIMIPVANMKSTMSRADTKITVFFRWVVGTRADTRVFTRPIQPLPINNERAELDFAPTDQTFSHPPARLLQGRKAVP